MVEFNFIEGADSTPSKVTINSLNNVKIQTYALNKRQSGLQPEMEN